jgi:hypothetical protein
VPSVISNLTGVCVLLCKMDARSFTVPAVKTSADLEADEITSSELAVDGGIEQGEIADGVCEFETDATSPDVLRQQWALLTYDATVVPCPL